MNMLNTNMVSVTQVQRNFKAILDNLSASNPTLVFRDSIPEAVLLSFDEYKRIMNLEKKILINKVLKNMDYLAKVNENFSDEEIEKDIEYAKKHISGSR